MRREPLKYAFLTVAAVLLIVEFILLASGFRILLSEEFFPEHEASSGTFFVPAEEAQFGCTYFTGRKKVYVTLSSYRFDECPFIWTEGKQ